MKIPGELQRKLRNAFLDAFQQAELKRLVGDRLDVGLDHIVDKGPLPDRVDGLLG